MNQCPTNGIYYALGKNEVPDSACKRRGYKRYCDDCGSNDSRQAPVLRISLIEAKGERCNEVHDTLHLLDMMLKRV